ncbi:MAG: hypothetical protein HFJ53_03260 [Clostridia bacterium]|nr:hypothetical protein [Clostridia bacterium]
MKSKEELIKQVVILVIALFVVIVMAICLNMGKGKKDDKEITVRNSQNTTIEENKNEMIDNLKGLLEAPTQNEFEDSGTIKQPIETGVKHELRTNSNEVIRYEEIWNGDN